jgi:hypothetical protein
MYQDLVQGLIQQQDFIASRVELLHENTACKMLGRFTHVSKVENLLLALFFIIDILQSFVRVSPTTFTFHWNSRTSPKEVPFLWLVV